jgi:Fe-S cluster biogenesis protein NfuA
MIPFSDEDLLAPVTNIIDTKISPMLSQDGGAMSLLSIKDQVVYIQLQGACVGCAASPSTMKYIVEKEIKAAIHPELVIKNVPAGMEDRLEEL